MELGLVKDFVFWILEIPNMMEKKLAMEILMNVPTWVFTVEGLAPDYLLVSYQDGSNPSYLTDIYAGDVFKDCGFDNKCNEEEDGFNPGTCADGFSGSRRALLQT